MPTESGERVPARLQQTAGKPEPESLPCPRCDSRSTKFCYYNNYNLHQPRHFCKSCRRYWTQGGTLRNVPVGGGTRKGSSSSNNNKRSRTSSSSATSASSSSSSSTLTHDPTPANAINMVPGPRTQVLPPSFIGDLNLNEAAASGGFTSLLNNQSHGGFCGLGGYGVGPGFHEMGFGLGMAVWPMEQVHHDQGNGGGGGGRGDSDSPGGFNTWQMGGGGDVEGGLAGDDCFGWPDLAISTPTNCLK